MTPAVPGARRLVWLGHATVLLELHGARILTDPALSQRIGHLRRHASGATPPHVDAVFVSHLHHDHADMPTLRALPGDPVIYGPPGAARVLRGLDVVEVVDGDRFDVAGVEVRVVHAAHEVRRFPWSEVTVSLGLIADGVYFAGDTEIFPGMADFGHIDTAILPVWGWGPSLGPGHLDPLEAARALALIAPRVAVPIHWGTLLPIGLHRRFGHLLTDPPVDFARHACEHAPAVDVRIPAIGQPINLKTDIDPDIDQPSVRVPR